MPCVSHPCLAMNKARIYEHPPFLFFLKITQCIEQRTTETCIAETMSLIRKKNEDLILYDNALGNMTYT